MNGFVLLARPSGEPIPETVHARYAATPWCRTIDRKWHHNGPVSILVASNRLGFLPMVGCWKSYVAVGSVRLDNRATLERWVDFPSSGLSDLELVLRSVAQAGDGCVPDILGDLAVVIWNHTTRSLLAVRDVFGVKSLYYTQQNDLVGFSSRADALAMSECYDQKALIELCAVCERSPDQTIYAGVKAVPPGHTASLQGKVLTLREYWSPRQFEPQPAIGTDGETYEAFRHLFASAVRCRLTGGPDTWAQLSGGLDSSSVVSMAQHLFETGVATHGVAGTVSWVDRWAKAGDERRYSEAVAHQFGLRNKALIDGWWWEDDTSSAPPLTEQPDPMYPMYARERRSAAIVRQAGGRVLLTGYGSDNYLIGNMFFFADWVARGQLYRSAREILKRASLGRVSFWNLAYQNVVLPMLPRGMRRVLVPGAQLPAWVTNDLARRFGLRETTEASSYRGQLGQKYAGLVLQMMRGLPYALERHRVIEEELEVRHPFLHRPLVEFSLQLPPEMCVQPHARKWVLREAMRGILPEIVRSRVGKGSNEGCVVRSLMHERRCIEQMINSSILAELGCIDANKLRKGYVLACEVGAEYLVTPVLYTLAVETWLQARSGRWPPGRGSCTC